MSAEVAHTTLNRLLDRIEEKPDRILQVAERVPDGITSAGDLRAFEAVLADAERAGAIEVRRHRKPELRHLLEKAVLLDRARLYAFLGRESATQKAERLKGAIADALPYLHAEALPCMDRLIQGWRLARRPFGVPAVLAEAMAFLRSLDAVLRRPEGDRRDLRTISAQMLGDSKLLEGQLLRVTTALSEIGRIPAGLAPIEAAAAAGLQKFGHPVLVGGDVILAGMDISALAYLGIPPDDIGRISATQPLTSLLTVENLTCFNRHVREVRSSSQAVVYTGGFPTPSVIALLRRLITPGQTAVWHWGDIDGGGIRIADYLARQVAPDLRLHLMSPEIAARHGRPAVPQQDLASLDASPDVRTLAGYLSSEGCHHLEQEIIDPVRVA